MLLGHCTEATTMAQDTGINHSQPHVDAAVVSHRQPTKVHPPTRTLLGCLARSVATLCQEQTPLHWHYIGLLHSAPGSGI